MEKHEKGMLDASSRQVLLRDDLERQAQRAIDRNRRLADSNQGSVAFGSGGVTVTRGAGTVAVGDAGVSVNNDALKVV